MTALPRISGFAVFYCETSATDGRCWPFCSSHLFLFCIFIFIFFQTFSQTHCTLLPLIHLSFTVPRYFLYFLRSLDTLCNHQYMSHHGNMTKQLITSNMSMCNLFFKFPYNAWLQALCTSVGVVKRFCCLLIITGFRDSRIHC